MREQTGVRESDAIRILRRRPHRLRPRRWRRDSVDSALAGSTGMVRRPEEPSPAGSLRRHGSSRASIDLASLVGPRNQCVRGRHPSPRRRRQITFVNRRDTKCPGGVYRVLNPVDQNDRPARTREASPTAREFEGAGSPPAESIAHLAQNGRHVRDFLRDRVSPGSVGAISIDRGHPTLRGCHLDLL